MPSRGEEGELHSLPGRVWKLLAEGAGVHVQQHVSGKQQSAEAASGGGIQQAGVEGLPDNMLEHVVGLFYCTAVWRTMVCPRFSPNHSHPTPSRGPSDTCVYTQLIHHYLCYVLMWVFSCVRAAYRLLPMGSHPRVADKRGTYDLFGPVNKLWGGGYDKAMSVFLACLREFGDFARAR